MSYLVLARKWRPQTFEDLVGQEHVGRTLGNAIRSERVHHAFLFTGARGVGKTSAARILAKALNCETGPTPTPCNTCPACVEITAGQGGDVFEIDGASNTGVDDVRDLRDNIRYLPASSRFKIFIIDEVHMLSVNAFNALLKTLEEPPPHAKFIFATTEPHKIPITILSRCQRFDFRKIPQGRIAARLREIVDSEAISISDRALSLVARRGEGSMRDALSTLDQVIAFCGETVEDDDVQGLLGLVDRSLLLEAVKAVLRRDARTVLEIVQRVDEQGYSYRRYCQELTEVFRAIVLFGAVDDPSDLVDLSDEEARELKVLASEVEPEEAHRGIALLLKTEQEIAGAPYPRLILEMSLVRLASLPPARDVSFLVKKIEDIEKKLSISSPLPPPSPPLRESPFERGGPPGKKPEAPATSGNDKGWQGFVEHVRSRRRPGIASLLEHGSLLKLELPTIEVGFPQGSFHYEQMRDQETLEILKDLARDYYGDEVNFLITSFAGKGSSPPSLAEEKKSRETDRKKRLREDALKHPMVVAALDIFKGEVGEVRPDDKGYV